jgi:hypothetical protein
MLMFSTFKLSFDVDNFGIFGSGTVWATFFLNLDNFFSHLLTQGIIQTIAKCPKLGTRFLVA